MRTLVRLSILLVLSAAGLFAQVIPSGNIRIPALYPNNTQDFIEVPGLYLNTSGLIPRLNIGFSKGTSLPTDCQVGEAFFKSDNTPGENLYFCTSLPGTWTQIVATGGTGLSSATDLNSPLFCSDAGASDAYACSLSPAILSYTTGAHYRFKANTSNTGAATINLNSIGAKAIVKVPGGITTTLADSDIRAGQWVDVVYDGTNMQMQSTLGNATSGAGTVTHSAGALTEDALVVGNASADAKASSILVDPTTSKITSPGGADFNVGSTDSTETDYTDGASGFKVTVTPTTLTANHTQFQPDAAGTYALTGSALVNGQCLQGDASGRIVPTGAACGGGGSGGAWGDLTGSFTNQLDIYAAMFGAAAPPTTSWSWVNQSTSTAATQGNFVHVSIPDNGSLNWRVYERTEAVSSAFTWISFLDIYQFAIGTQSTGVYLLETGATPKMIGFETINAGSSISSSIRILHINSPTSAGSVVANSAIYPQNIRRIGFKVVYDGTNYAFSYSLNNGGGWTSLLSESATAFLSAPVAVGFGGVSITSNAAYTVGADLVGYSFQ